MFTSTPPTANGFYGYRVSGQPDTIILVEGFPPPDTASTDPPVGYFFKESRSHLLSDLSGEFCGPFVLPE